MITQHGRMWIALGALLAGLAVATGALAAHGLEDFFAKKYADTPAKKEAGVELPAAQKYLHDFKTAAEYQMYHALGLLAIGLLMTPGSSRLLSAAAWALLLGILIFSGCLYVLTLTGQRWLGMIVPIGGVSFLIGWGLFAVGAMRHRS